ncbi:GGDEF domain-containing protein [Kineosporia succinea]|uniref:Diguanylate cyclase (GGDEF)-like protein n=1 Tax=Kineosporia succinea TaxID=84632 RepID=A0ABT9NVV4_9ACTN|nr:GGDEF domain-containing protein [Kineosporia succinea]MDP9824547.1 diguanylate cyclase (GGDEF)-like protein [Kineosporia succinea]
MHTLQELRKHLPADVRGRLQVHLPHRQARRRDHRLLIAGGVAVTLIAAAAAVYTARTRLKQLLDKRSTENSERGLDTLTGLPNRAEAQWWLNTRLARARNRNHRLAVMILDINGFADLNEIHGREVGDHVLQVTAARMQSQLRTGDMVCRVANDTFMVIMDAIGPDHLIARIGERVVTTVSEPISFHGEPITISASVGFAISLDKDKTPELLLDRADRALVQAKASNRNVVQF